jgi:hypothetical protein
VLECLLAGLAAAAAAAAVAAAAHLHCHPQTLFEVLWLASLAVVQQPRRGRQGKLKAVPASGREPHQRRTDYYYYYLLLLPVLFGFSSSTTVCRRPPSLFL